MSFFNNSPFSFPLSRRAFFQAWGTGYYRHGIAWMRYGIDVCGSATGDHLFYVKR